MFLVTRGFPVLLELGLLVYCLIECLQSPPSQIRGMSKVGWVMLIVVVPFVGGIAWLVAGRPLKPAPDPWQSRLTGFPPPAGTATAPRGPEDDPEFLAEIQKINEEQERTLAQWEADLKRREEALRHDGPHERWREGPATPTPDGGDRPQDAD